MSHTQSRTAPQKMPPRRQSTSKLPKAFCSGPCRHRRVQNSIRCFKRQQCFSHAELKAFIHWPCTLWVPQWGHTRWDSHCSNRGTTLAWSSSPDRHTLQCSRMQERVVTVKQQQLEAPSETSAWFAQSGVHTFQSDPTRYSLQSRWVHTCIMMWHGVSGSFRLLK